VNPNNVPPIVCPGIFIAEHPINMICQTHDGVKLHPCSQIIESVDINTRYMCAITNGLETPREDAYIEWHWYAKYTVGGGDVYTTGKFIFVASAAYIIRQHGLHGYQGISGNGIGMFNPSNHNL
jgi:hypothetical protein